MEPHQPSLIAKEPKLAETEEQERIIKLLESRLEKHDDNRRSVQDKLRKICTELHAKIDELEEGINKELEEKFKAEDSKFQAMLSEVRGNSTASVLQRVKAELLVEQSYEITKSKLAYGFDFTALYKLETERHIEIEPTEIRKPTNVRVTGVNRGRVFVEFTCLSPDEERILSDNTIVNPAKYKCMVFKEGDEQESKEEYTLHKNEGDNSSFFFTFTPDIIDAEATYGVRVKMVIGDNESKWSDATKFSAPKFEECCVWKKCPDNVHSSLKYRVDEKNPRVATKINHSDYGYCTIIGNTHVPLSTVTSWSIKVLKSRDNDGSNILIGVAPNDVNQDGYYNYDECGWYFYCGSSVLYSGPPHKYNGKEYGPRKGYGQYVHTGDSVGVVVDTTKGELSFVLDGVNHGVAYEGIPLDKPLVPCVILKNEGDSVELII